MLTEILTNKPITHKSCLSGDHCGILRRTLDLLRGLSIKVSKDPYQKGVLTELEKSGVKLSSCLITGWPNYSGSISYPIPHPSFSNKDPQTLFEKTPHPWGYTLYADSRREFCKYLHTELTNYYNI